MRHEVSLQFDLQNRLEIPVDGHDLPAADLARRWLDDEFTRLECAPLRASGKVLTVDKLLAVASAAGPASFDDPSWRREFARAACAATGKPSVRVDLSTMTVKL
jgi:hypothetical protein